MKQDTYYVFNPGNNTPQIKHNSFEDAEFEAMRLAKLHPDREFVVLKLKASFTAETSVVMKCKYC